MSGDEFYTEDEAEEGYVTLVGLEDMFRYRPTASVVTAQISYRWEPLSTISGFTRMLRPEDVLVTDRAGFRSWFLENCDTATECYLKISVGPDDSGVPYLDSVEEALCFGWIDTTVKNVDGIGRVQRFTPRRRLGRWTELNKARCERLERLGLMTDRGRQALSWAPEFSIDDDIMEILKSEPGLYENFVSFPELYRRVRIDNIQAYRRSRPQVFSYRLEKFIDCTRRGVMYGKWDDGGRLS